MTTTMGQPIMKEEYVQAEETATRKEVKKQKQVKRQKTKPIETASTRHLTKSEGKVDTPSDSRCKHYFGYLGHRDKGEGIPDACLECPKSLDCMLSDYYRSKETVEEIKKWYPAKA